MDSNPFQAPKAKPPESKASRERRLLRAASLVPLFLFAGFLVLLGGRGSHFGPLPAHFVGLALAGFGALGIAGVNIWRGGEMDPRLDRLDEGNQPTGRAPG